MVNKIMTKVQQAGDFTRLNVCVCQMGIRLIYIIYIKMYFNKTPIVKCN